MIEFCSLKDYKGAGISSFDCGEEALNSFLREYASQNERKGIGRTFLMIEDGYIAGYFTLSAAQIECENIPEKERRRLPRYPLPAIRIARFAVSKDKQRRGYGKRMMRFVLQKALSAAFSVGVVFITVDAKPEAVAFYEKFGFVKTVGTERTYVIPISVIGKAMGLL